jgi:DNA-binding MarR family transcriptional regulator
MSAVREDEVAAPYRLEDSVGHLLRRAHQRHVALFQGTGPGAPLTPTQFAVLVKLAELGQASQNRLGRLVAMDPATIQGVVQRLMARDLLRSERDPADRRAVLLRSTGAGLAAVAAAEVQARRANEAVLEPLAPEERAALLALLRRVAG